MHRVLYLALVSATTLLAAVPARAELIELKLLQREPFAGGKAFGDVGPYEKLVGVARFAVDPKNPRNRIIVDLDLAPRNQDGKVEFESDVFILAPQDPARGNGAILFDVNNRGNKLALGMFNYAPRGNDPTTVQDAGDGFLMRKGYTIVWCGWIGELLPGDHRLLMRAPIATNNSAPITGLVRFETVSDKPAESMPLSYRDHHGSYPLTPRGEKEGTLTWRQRETDERVPIPREQWSIQRLPIPTVAEGVPGALGQVRLRVAGGFRPGYLYELIAEAEGPIVQGLGFAAVRDLVSFLKYDDSTRNPVVKAIKRAHGFGVSQSGRFLRNYLYDGFNVDEKDRKVFDGLMPHVAGGGLGYFNHRFAQPTRHNAQHEEHLYPADRFPFTYGDSANPFTGKEDGICRRTSAESAELLPRIMHTQSAAEYWHRSGSLVHTDPLGKIDAVIPDGVRVYAFGGTQHGPASDPPKRDTGDNLPNPGDYRPFLRALLEALDAWTRDGTTPPPSLCPSIDRHTLVDWHRQSSGFPAIPGVRYPEVIQRPHALDHGPEFATRGILSVLPPRIVANYVVLVPRSDPDGNDLGTLLPPDVAVPLATHTGWNLRSREFGAEGELVSLTGSYIPFPRTKAERLASGDPRLSIEERYGSFAEYQKRFVAVCDGLVEQRYLLNEDAQRARGKAESRRGLVTAEPTKKQ
jgi:hypothetical protein